MTNRLEQLAAINEAYRQKQAKIAELQQQLEEIEQFTQQVRAALDVPFEKQAEEIEELARAAAEALELVMRHDLFNLALDGTTAKREGGSTLALLYSILGGECREGFRNSLDALKVSLPDLAEDDDHADF